MHRNELITYYEILNKLLLHLSISVLCQFICDDLEDVCVH